MKLIAIGDNVTDCYLDQKLYYPGGNAVNVAVNCRRNGAEQVAYIGVFGDDENAGHIKGCLEKEAVSFERSRKVYAISGRPKVVLQDGDRVFVAGPRDTCQHLFRIKLVAEDYEWIRRFDVCHTSCYSNLEYELPELKQVLAVSFDFSDQREPSYLARVCPHLTYGFFSGSELTEEEAKALLLQAVGLGTKIAGVTRGSKGALFYDGKSFYSQEIVKTTVIDTMGAGDSFIAGFLTKYQDTRDMKAALSYAAERAANTCTFYGGFGYPHPME